MKNNELRIGNWVFWDEPNTGEIEISRIDSQDFKLIEIHESDYNPIPITPEILEKAGFDIYDKNGIKYILLEKSLLSFIVISGYLILSYWDGKKFVDMQTRVQFVHQLQNLYFALTGEELPIEL